jgi:hypothetical protein
MKLTSNRPVDQVHVADLLRMDLINDAVRSALPEGLHDRLDQIRQLVDE